VNPHHLGDNLNGAARYLRHQFNEFGRYDLALAAYNSGPSRVWKVGRIPYIRETQDYVRIILSNWRQLEQSNGAP
jgi:soluble lytic murein transglycosylase-like protein